MRLSRALALAIACAAPFAWAEGQTEALQLLQRVAAASQRTSYSGTFIYQSGQHTETSRIVHLAEPGGESERIEVLDGSPREVVRVNDEVRCFLPDSRLVIVERRETSRSFPAVLPANLGILTDHYVIRKGPGERVAGFDSQRIVIEPKDDLRYGHHLWADSQSGLLLRTSLIGERGEVLEAFSFTELRIGGPFDRESLKPKTKADHGDWRVLQTRSSGKRADEERWRFGVQLPGFRKISGVKRRVHPDAPEGSHWVFSDGLAAISVFIEPPGVREERTEGAQFSMGPINVYRRVVADHMIVVMGDVPSRALKRLADGIEPKRK